MKYTIKVCKNCKEQWQQLPVILFPLHFMFFQTSAHLSINYRKRTWKVFSVSLDVSLQSLSCFYFIGASINRQMLQGCISYKWTLFHALSSTFFSFSCLSSVFRESIIEMGYFSNGLCSVVAGKFALNFSLKFLSLFVHISGSIEPITLIWLLLEDVKHTCR